MNTTNKDDLVPEVFSVVVLYEDRETRDRVLEVSRHMAIQVGDEIQLKFSWWRFDFLQDPELAQQAANAASVADMLLVSAHPGRSLPLEFTQWIERWLPGRGYRESVLVALIGSGHDATDDAATEYLRGIATRARMDYLAQSGLSSPVTPQSREQTVPKRTESRTPVSDSNLRQIAPSSHWGINE